VNNFTGESESILKYAAVKNSLGSSEIGRITPIVLSVCRIFLGVVVLTESIALTLTSSEKGSTKVIIDFFLLYVQKKKMTKSNNFY
jgi:hypothetical protein